MLAAGPRARLEPGRHPARRALANQAALGLALLEAEQRRVTQSERDHALARAARALNVSLELAEVLDTLAREADLAVGGAIARVYLLDEIAGCGVATAGHNCPTAGTATGWRPARASPARCSPPAAPS